MGPSTQKIYQKGRSTFMDQLESIEQICKESKVIIVGCLASWAVHHLGLGLAGLILLLAVCRTYYAVTIHRVERTIRDELRRYHAKHTLKRGESVEWMNDILGRCWHLYQPQICDQIIDYINAGLATQDTDQTPPQKLVIRSMAVVEQPLRFLRIRTYTQPQSQNFVLEGRFQVSLAPPSDLPHHRLHLLDKIHDEPLLDLVIENARQDRRQHDLAVQVRQVTGTGVIRLEIDFAGAEPQILPPQIELQGQPQIDCTYRAVSQHHFPFHFAHQVDWRRVVEMQIREGLGRAFHRPLPLLQLIGERLVMRMMTWWWLLHRVCRS